MNQCYGCSTCKSADKPLEGYVPSAFKVFVVVFAQMVPVGLHRNPLAESAVPMQTLSSLEICYGQWLPALAVTFMSSKIRRSM